MLCPHFGQISKQLFLYFWHPSLRQTSTLTPHWTGCPCSARRPDFTSRAVPHATTLQANTQVLNPRQRNQQILLANEPWHLWVHMGSLANSWCNGAGAPLLKQWGRGWRLKSQLFWPSDESELSPSSLAAFLSPKRTTQEVNIDSVAHQNLIWSHGGVWGEVESSLHPVCPSILFSWYAWNRVCFVPLIYLFPFSSNKNCCWVYEFLFIKLGM